MWEAPVEIYRTSVGLDVHARSVVACGLDRSTGEVFERRLTPDYREILEWVGSLPGPAMVTYEAGPTGFGLARSLVGAGIECVVAAPSKLQRPAGIGSRPTSVMPASGAVVASGGDQRGDGALGGAGSRPRPGARSGGLPRGFDDPAAPVVQTAAAARDRLLRR